MNNSALLVEALQRRLDRDSSLLPAASDVAARREVCSLVHAVRSMQEVAAPLAAHFLLGGDGVYVSHTFALLMLASAIAVHKHEEYACRVAAHDSRDVVTAAADDYRLRPAELEHVSPYWFVALFQKVKLKDVNGGVHEDDRLVSPEDGAGGSTGDGGSKAPLRFLPEHVQAATHCVVAGRLPAVPDIQGPRVPNADALDRSEDADEGQEAAECALSSCCFYSVHTDLVILSVGTLKGDCSACYLSGALLTKSRITMSPGGYATTLKITMWQRRPREKGRKKSRRN